MLHVCGKCLDTTLTTTSLLVLASEFSSPQPMILPDTQKSRYVLLSCMNSRTFV